MNEQSSSLQSAPRPICAALAPLLPLLSLGKLDPEEAEPLREHVATCDFCRSQLRDFDALRDALRRYGARAGGAELESSERVPMLTLATILSAVHGEDGDDADDEARDGHVAASPLTPPLAAPRPRATPPRWPRRRRGRWTGLGALAAALLLVLLAGALIPWRAEQSAGIVVAVPGLGSLTEFPLPTAGSQPNVIVAGRDGNLWFTEDGAGGQVGRITPRGVVAEFPLPSPLPAGEIFDGLAAGPDGTIWYTDDAGKIGRLRPRDGQITEFVLPTRDLFPVFIVAGPDGNVWFGAEPYTGDYPGEIGRITPGGAIKEFPLPDATPYVNGLAAGPDGNLWFNSSGPGDNRIGRMSTAGVITWYSVPLSFPAGCKCQRSLVSAGPDGNIWYVSAERTQDANVFRVRVARISPHGAITEFALPGNLATVSNAGPKPPLISGPDGNLWFMAGDGQSLERITPQGAITEFAFPAGVTLGSITVGPDGNLWFTDPAANTIDRLELYH